MNSNILLLVQIFSLVAVGGFFFRLFSWKKQSMKNSSSGDGSWQYGDEWRSDLREVDLSEWKEVVTAVKYGLHKNISFVAILEKRNQIEESEIDLLEVQEILATAGINSQIGPSREFGDADGLFVEEKDFESANRLLKIPR